MKRFEYETCCVNSTAELIHAMVDRAIEVTYETVHKHCQGLSEWAANMGYEASSRTGLTLKEDWAVSYYRSRYNGRPCYYVRHSAIEHIWLEVK
jgi:hypothetical protein